MITLSHMKPSILIAVVLLLIIAVIHLLRFLFQEGVTVGTVAIPVWVSLPAMLITAGLAIWLWFDNRI